MTNNLKEQLDLTDSPETMCGALRNLANEIQSPDDVPQLCLRDAANTIEKLAAEVRRLTELRPMEEVKDVVGLFEEKSSGWLRIGAHYKGRIHTQDSGSFGANEFKGWLPLPTPTSAEG